MSIETNIERIATALEKLIDLQAGRNLVLEAQAAQPQPDATEAAAEAVEKAATKGRRKKADPEPKEEPVVEKEQAPEPEAEEAAPAAPAVAEVQKRAAQLAAKHSKQVIFDLIGKAEGADGKISKHTPEQLVTLMALFDELEVGIE